MRAADRHELVTLCRTAGFFATHQRDYGDRIFEATEESLAIARESESRLQISHLQMNGPANAGRAGDLLALLDRALQDGVDIACDTYPYTAGSTFIQSLLPAWAVDGGPDAIMERLHNDQTRQQIETFLNAANLGRHALQPRGSDCPGKTRPLKVRRFALIADRRGLTIGELVCRLLREEELRALLRPPRRARGQRTRHSAMDRPDGRQRRSAPDRQKRTPACTARFPARPGPLCPR